MRHAIYFTPDSASGLHALGSSWLGRDAVNGSVGDQPIDPRLAGITEEPRRYGFHGTLKPPFRMRDGMSFAALESAVRAVAQHHCRFEAGQLSLQVIDGFLALVLLGENSALGNLAADCVRHLDDFRVPATEDELARRRAAGLSARQDGNLIRWGYPYILDDFRFHFTLSRRLNEHERDWALPMARSHFAPILGIHLMIDALSIVTEPADSAPFKVDLRLPLAVCAARAA